VTGVGLLRTAHGFDARCECAFFLPSTEMAKIWVLVRTPSGSNGPVVLDWKFSCELTAGTDRFAAEEIFHWGYIEWDWGDSPEDTLVGDTTKLTVARGEAEECPNHSRSICNYSERPTALRRYPDRATGQSCE